MISLSSVTFDLDGSVVLHNTDRSDLTNTERRVTRTATLDGGVVLADMGYVDGDRTLRVSVRNPSLELEGQTAYLQRTYPLVIMTCREGGFLGTIATMQHRRGELSIDFLVKEKLTED